MSPAYCSEWSPLDLWKRMCSVSTLLVRGMSSNWYKPKWGWPIRKTVRFKKERNVLVGMFEISHAIISVKFVFIFWRPNIFCAHGNLDSPHKQIFVKSGKKILDWVAQYEKRRHAMLQIGQNYSTFKGRDSCRFSGTCSEHQKQHHDEVQGYQLARFYDQNN